MARPRFEPAIGAINGVNRVFRTSVPYDAGSLAVFLNGQLKRRDYDDGWAETNPASGVFVMNEAPKVLDDVQAFYLDSGEQTLVVAQIRNLTARIRPQVKMVGHYRTTTTIRGKIACAAR